MKKEILFIALIAASFIVYFSLTTESEYKKYPKGDAKTYTLMALHFNEPEKIEEELPTIYSQRLLPPLIAYIFSHGQIQAYGDQADDIKTRDDTIRRFAKPFNLIILTSWQISNIIAYLVQLFFIFLLLSRLKIDNGLKYFMLAIYSMWFLSTRLYFNWIQMPDPWAFAFLSAAAYFTVTLNTPGFLVSVVLGSMCKEMLLFMIPTYIWRAASGGVRKARPVEYLAVCVIPAAVFLLLREFPYFASTISTPNIPIAKKVEEGVFANPVDRLKDYMALLQYHYIMRMRLDPWYFLDTLIIPFGAFAGVSYFLLWRCRETYAFFREHLYWLPYIALNIVVGINVDRYIIFLFPPVILFTALVLQNNYKGRRLLAAMILLAVTTAWSQDLFRFISEENAITLKHQLEITSLRIPALAAEYRWLVGKTALLGFSGFLLLDIPAIRRAVRKV